MTRSEEDAILERRSIAAGQTIVKEGEPGHAAFLIQEGRVQVYTGGADKRVDLAVLGPGQIFGEMALLFDEPRVATVVALEKCNLVMITREILKKKLEKSDPTMRAILPMLMKRIIQTNNVLLQRQEDIDQLVETTTMIYQNIHSALPASQKQSLEKDVLPKLDELINVIKAFRERYVGHFQG